MSIKTLVGISGGKDSVATSIKVLQAGWNPEFLFCDTGWEHPALYKYLEYLQKALGINIRFLKSDKYDNFIDMVIRKGRFPSTMARFCTEELKVKPMINYILDSSFDDFLLFQGIRKLESVSRSKMNKNCTYFKYYFEPYKHDRKGNPQYHIYRKDEIKKTYGVDNHVHDVQRPVFDNTAEEVFDIHKEAGIEPNPLYKMNVGRVGCFPCINVNLDELWSIYIRQPQFLYDLADYEEKLGTTFFAPDFIPRRYCSKQVDVWKKTDKFSQQEIEYLNGQMNCEIEGDKIHIKMNVPTVHDVIKYLEDKHASGHLFDENNSRRVTSCDSIYNICE